MLVAFTMTEWVGSLDLGQTQDLPSPYSPDSAPFLDFIEMP